jgi:hypothetical protein
MLRKCIDLVGLNRNESPLGTSEVCQLGTWLRFDNLRTIALADAKETWAAARLG